MIKKLHILFLSSWYPSDVDETIGNFVKQHAEAIASKHNVSVVYSVGDDKLKSKYVINDFAENNVTTIIVYFKKHSNRIINSLRKIKALKLGLKEVDDYDLVHGNVLNPIGIFVYLFAKRKKKPYIFTEHWSGFLEKSSFNLSLIRRMIIKFVVKKAKYIIPVSDELKIEMLKQGYKGTYKTIGNVVDTMLFFPIEKTNKTYTILHVSSFSNKQKNIDGILNVIKKLSENRNDFVFKIIGDGDLSNLQNKINKLKIGQDIIQVEGTKSPKEIAVLLQNSNLYVSFSNYETFGIVMVESIACGIPVISTKTGILYELGLEDFTTFIDAKDENALYRSINDSIDENKIYDSRKMHSIIKSEYSVESIANKYSEIYFDVLKGKNS